MQTRSNQQHPSFKSLSSCVYSWLLFLEYPLINALRLKLIPVQIGTDRCSHGHVRVLVTMTETRQADIEKI